MDVCHSRPSPLALDAGKLCCPMSALTPLLSALLALHPLPFPTPPLPTLVGLALAAPAFSPASNLASSESYSNLCPYVFGA